MAIQFFCGNEKGDYRGDGLLEVGMSVIPAINQRGGRGTLQSNGGSWYYYVGPGVGTPSTAYLQKSLSGPLTEAYGQFAWLTPNGPSGNMDMWQFYLGSVLIGFIRAVNQGGNVVRFSFFRGDGTQIGSQTPDSFNTVALFNTLIEWHIKPAASGGVFELWVNGVLEIQVLNGNITGPGGEVTFDNVRFGTSNGTNCLFDDIMVNDLTGTINNARTNGVYVVPIFGILPGTFSQLLNSFGNSLNNYAFVNNLPANRSNIGYLGTNTPGQKDTHRMAPPPLEFTGFAALKVSVLAAGNGPAIGHVQGVLIPNAEAEIDLTQQVIPKGGFGWLEFLSEINPNTSAPYTAAEVANLEAGPKFAA